MKFSLIIPAWNEEAFIADTLQSVMPAVQHLASGGKHVGEVIVVDNNSTDSTARIADDCGATVVFESVNQIARARNRGASVATGEALVFLDADTRCSERLLCHVLDRMATGKVLGGGAIIAPDGPVTPTARRALQLWNAISRALTVAAGCFVFCRRDAFAAAGGFNDRVYAGEEIFLSRALKRQGKRTGMAFEIVTVDPVNTSMRKLEWYGTGGLIQQGLLVMIPGAVLSRRFCRTWYEDRGRGRSSKREH